MTDLPRNMPKPFRENSQLSPGAWDLKSFVASARGKSKEKESDNAFGLPPDGAASQSPTGALCDSLLDDRQRPAMPRDVLLALTYGLELVRCGAMLVGNEGNPYFANRSAWEILKKNDGLSLARTGLVAERASDTLLLRRLLREAITSSEISEPQGSPLSLPRKKARTSLIVRVLPGPGLECWPDEQNRAALLTIYDEEKSVQVDEAVLIKLYGLTRGEAQLAAILLRGKSIEEAAAELFISPHTARTHLKRIFMKTDTHRQTELVVRIFSALL
jgi:DNA-binding CsgD family transcriptional regulator